MPMIYLPYLGGDIVYLILGILGLTEKEVGVCSSLHFPTSRRKVMISWCMYAVWCTKRSYPGLSYTRTSYNQSSGLNSLNNYLCFGTENHCSKICMTSTTLLTLPIWKSRSDLFDFQDDVRAYVHAYGCHGIRNQMTYGKTRGHIRNWGLRAWMERQRMFEIRGRWSVWRTRHGRVMERALQCAIAIAMFWPRVRNEGWDGKGRRWSVADYWNGWLCKDRKTEQVSARVHTLVSA